jgi:hypothetical protein
VKHLNLNNKYSREEVHQIFSPDTKFTPGAGTWGLHGIVRLPGRQSDFVFFVTYGQKQGGHTFDEGISEDGILRWQSQPKQGFDKPVIQTLINHDDTKNSIYLFLREDEKDDYRYLGRLKYVLHDKSRENPVYFQWQILDWPVRDNTQQYNIEEPQKLRLTSRSPTSKNGPLERTGVTKDEFRNRVNIDYAERDKKNAALGLKGEELVVTYEKEVLFHAGRKDLSGKVTHVSVVEGDGAGYDIRSYTAEGEVKHIEVKTTNGDIDTDFFISPNEINFAKSTSDTFYLYRIFNCSTQPEFYIERANFINEFEAIPTGFRMRRR